MMWLGIAVTTLTVLALALVLIAIGAPDRATTDREDPLFTVGIAISGVSAALAVTLGPVMYVMLLVGLVVMVIGAQRTQRHRHH